MAAAIWPGPNFGMSLQLLDTRGSTSNARCPPRSVLMCFVLIERHRFFGDWCRPPPDPLAGHNRWRPQQAASHSCSYSYTRHTKKNVSKIVPGLNTFYSHSYLVFLTACRFCCATDGADNGKAVTWPAPMQARRQPREDDGALPHHTTLSTQEKDSIMFLLLCQNSGTFFFHREGLVRLKWRLQTKAGRFTAGFCTGTVRKWAVSDHITTTTSI